MYIKLVPFKMEEFNNFLSKLNFIKFIILTVDRDHKQVSHLF